MLIITRRSQYRKDHDQSDKSEQYAKKRRIDGTERRSRHAHKQKTATPDRRQQ
ncbi:hypothetical protein SRABI106_04570 [Rahnella aquatilis]|nr:hypothetical protein SRABI106_04570 [Rahnella aquatilis]